MKNLHLKLLREHRLVRQLSTIQLIAYLGTWFSTVAVYVLMSKLGANPMLIALIAVMNFLPGIIQAPIAGAIIDKISFKPLMLSLLFVELFATAGLLYIDRIELAWLLLALVFIRMSASSFYFTSEMSLMPQVLTADELKTTNELHSVIWSFTYTAGMALGGFIVDLYGVRTAIIIDIIMFAIAIAIFIGVRVDVVIEKSTDKLLKQVGDGIRYLKENKLVVYLIILHASVGLTAYDALVTLLADYQYKGVISIALAIGLINSVRALGLTMGPFFVGKYINKNNLDFVMFMQAFFIILWGFLQFDFWLSLIGVFFTGFLTTSIWSLSYAMLQAQTDKAYLGRVMSYNEMGFMSLSVFGSFLIGFLYEDFGVELKYITFTLGGLFLLMAWYYRVIKKHYI